MATTTKPFPKPIKFRKLLGPSFVILALGLGSGEVILWPFLVSNWGLGIAWGALLGITCQFFMNMEIERYALIKGESVFVGLNQKFRFSAYWFILSTFIGFGLPGIIAASAKVFSTIVGIEDFRWVAIGLLVFIGLVLSIGKTVYGTMERITKTIIFIGVPFIFILALVLAGGTDWSALAGGLVGRGAGFNWLPSGISFAAFFAAFAYSGAGGNLNLTQSIYVKEKGYGMGKYSQKIAGLFTGLREKQKIKLKGEDFELTPANLKNFRAWWKKINLEHLLIFWLIGAFAMCMLMLLAYTTAFGQESNAEGIQFVINQGITIGTKLAPWVGTIFMFVVGVMLFQTQLGVMDSGSRIMAENYALKKLGAHGGAHINLSKIYFTFVWAQIIFGVILFLFNISEPRTLIILGAVLNAVAMGIHVALVNLMNQTALPKELRPGWPRKIIITIIFLIFASFGTFTVIDRIF